MKFREYINEDGSLMGMRIDNRYITPETRTKPWEDDFKCTNIGLKSLYGAPETIIGYFDCSENKLRTLMYAPKIVKGHFECQNNSLKTMEGSPIKVHGYIDCSHNNQLTSLKGITEEINGHLYASFTKLRDLKDIHKMIKKIRGDMYLWDAPIKSHVLGLLLIPGLEGINLSDDWGKILNKYIGKGRKGMLDCQNELIDMGLEEYAQI